MAKVLVLALIAFASVAQARPSTYKMTCSEAQALVQENGAVVMNYAYHAKAGHLYERFVKSSFYCALGETTSEMGSYVTVKTLDDNNCFIGRICKQDSND